MDFYLAAYNRILKIFGREILGILSRKSLKDPVFRKGRLGYYGDVAAAGKLPVVWFHAASVGEVTGAVPTLHAFGKRVPEAACLLSTGTPHGLRFARAQLSGAIPVIPFPLDFPECVERAITAISPDLFVAFETEFWPNFYNSLAVNGIPALLLNGRISESSRRLYGMASPLFSPILGYFDKMAMHSEEDRDRMLRIGVHPDRLRVLGSSKYEELISKARPEKSDYWKRILRIGETDGVIVGGSLRGSECVQLMRVYMSLREVSPGLVGIFVPRHLQNIPGMVRWLAERNVPFDLLTDIEAGRRERRASVVLVDRIGVLFEIYSIGDLIFCGGTLEPVGGHNILEPAAWAKPVFYGPYLKKVLHEHKILQNFGGSRQVRDAEDLQIQWRKYLADRNALAEIGAGGRRALNSLEGVVEHQVDLIVEMISNRKQKNHNAAT